MALTNKERNKIRDKYFTGHTYESTMSTTWQNWDNKRRQRVNEWMGVTDDNNPLTKLLSQSVKKDTRTKKQRQIDQEKMWRSEKKGTGQSARFADLKLTIRRIARQHPEMTPADRLHEARKRIDKRWTKNNRGQYVKKPSSGSSGGGKILGY